MVSHFPLSNSTVGWRVIIIYTYQRMFFALVNRCLVKDLRELKRAKKKRKKKQETSPLKQLQNLM